MSAEAQKAAAGEAAAARIEAGMTVGLGSGTTSAFFVRALARRAIAIRGVASSLATAALARSLGFALVELDEAGEIDLTVDGADEIGPDLACIKGGGGALLREKLVWRASRRRLVIADASKRVKTLGKFPLPVEVAAFGHGTTAARVAAVLPHGASGPVLRRAAGGAPFVTDSGNLIYDLALGAIHDPGRLAADLKALTGVVDHGLFLGLADGALIASDDGVEDLERGRA